MINTLLFNIFSKLFTHTFRLLVVTICLKSDHDDDAKTSTIHYSMMWVPLVANCLLYRYLNVNGSPKIVHIASWSLLPVYRVLYERFIRSHRNSDSRLRRESNPGLHELWLNALPVDDRGVSNFHIIQIYKINITNITSMCGCCCREG